MTSSKGITNALLIFGALLLGVVIAISVVTNPAGGLAALVPLISAIFGLTALFKPRVGLFGLAILVIWVDEFKRLAVYYGGAYSATHMQTLAMPYIVIGLLNAGYIINIFFGRVKIDRMGVMIYIAGIILGAIVFISAEASTALRAQRAASIAGYITVIPIACAYFKSFDDWRKFFAFQSIVALPCAAWAIQQYYNGFNEIEWVYARSMLSQTHSNQMFITDEPRVFGLFGSASALGCASMYCAFSFWHTFRHQKWRILWFLVAVIYVWVLICTKQRTALFYPLIVLFCAFIFRTSLRTYLLYASGAFFFVLSVINSTYLLEEGIDNTNEVLQKIAGDNEWAQRVLNVNTYSDRIRGWQLLNDINTYTLFGIKQKVEGYDTGGTTQTHDLITTILLSHGVVGILGIALSGFLLIRALHSTTFRQLNKRDRNDCAFSIALGLPTIYLSLIGGDNFSTNPINLQIWSSFVGGLILYKIVIQERKARREAKEKELFRLQQQTATAVLAPPSS